MKEKIIDIFEKTEGFMKHNGFKIVELDEKHSVVEYKVKKDGLNPYEIVHGGLLFGLADSCAGSLACMSGHIPLTTSSNINYLSPAKGKKIVAKATIMKSGKNIGYYMVDIFDEEGKKVANATVNMFFNDK